MSSANKSEIIPKAKTATLQSHPGYKIERIYNFPINCQLEEPRNANREMMVIILRR